MMKFRLLLIFVIASVTTACATNVAPANEYLLMDDSLQTVSTQETKRVSIQLLPIVVANYLAGNEIVLVTQQGEVHRSQSNLWAESLSSQLTRLTQQRLERTFPSITWFGGQRLPASAIGLLNIEVDGFYADLNGVVHISGRWQVISETGELSASDTFYVTDELQSDGYAAMVRTLSGSWFNRVIDPMTKDIAEVLNR
ncbi:hypothetical protein MUS1_11810 [Marinomonas ushuaiensis DSM 15871]|uniref:ABC-type transport auxiliary lipoprotein component domain-containing protein n=1 Tax=Marinomonas ushuaiensis DSM 15871 TaxID=1122207 RepID=X7E5B3_9GAMM|nr:ABC-type transport auxiliary lipoprotein family protein [Marinomonas ushuaiensis]ETX11055.1 hypothetical protein MUS1_11810 [Marinomonas ushuaiensis DSM 15871]